VCLVAPRASFALVPCGHARFCEACAMRVSVKRAGQFSLPHVGITNTERNRTKNFNSMSSSYNIPCSKHKLVVSIYSNTETSLAMSILAIWCRVVRSRDVRSRNFSAPLPPSDNTSDIVVCRLYSLRVLLTSDNSTYKTGCSSTGQVGALIIGTASQLRTANSAITSVCVADVELPVAKRDQSARCRAGSPSGFR